MKDMITVDSEYVKDSYKLRLLAQWLDVYDDEHNNDNRNVQSTLLRLARELERIGR